MMRLGDRDRSYYVPPDAGRDVISPSIFPPEQDGFFSPKLSRVQEGNYPIH